MGMQSSGTNSASRTPAAIARWTVSSNPAHGQDCVEHIGQACGSSGGGRCAGTPLIIRAARAVGLSTVTTTATMARTRPAGQEATVELGETCEVADEKDVGVTRWILWSWTFRLPRTSMIG